MKKLFFLILFLSFSMYSQSYLGRVSKHVNLRQGPGSEYKIIKSLKPGTQIFISSLLTDDDFYNVIDIQSDTEGYVHKSFVKVSEKVSKSSGGIFSPEGETSEYNPEIKIYNNTVKKLTLKLNSDLYHFEPYETKNITLIPGECDFRASAPGVQPYIGTEYLDGNRSYSWQFYISTYRR